MTGLGMRYDDYNESFADSAYARTEYVPGAFFEYTYKNLHTFTAVLGGRVDYHSIFGLQYSPRFHLKWNPDEETVIRLAGGKGFRSPNVILENAAVFASSRALIVRNGFAMEEALNYGISFTREFQLFGRTATIIIDYFRTDFLNQIIVDMETPGEVELYQLNGESSSDALQLDLVFEPAKGLDVSVAYKLVETTIQYDEGLKTKPYVPTHRGLIALDYTTPNRKWTFSVTNNFFGKSRVPSTRTNPGHYQRPTQSDPYYILHAQVQRKFRHYDLYIGGENLTSYHQHHAIIAADQPFSEYFDASMIWGPLNQRVIYLGIRFKVK